MVLPAAKRLAKSRRAYNSQTFALKLLVDDEIKKEGTEVIVDTQASVHDHVLDHSYGQSSMTSVHVSAKADNGEESMTLMRTHTELGPLFSTSRPSHSLETCDNVESMAGNHFPSRKKKNEYKARPHAR